MSIDLDLKFSRLFACFVGKSYLSCGTWQHYVASGYGIGLTVGCRLKPETTGANPLKDFRVL